MDALRRFLAQLREYWAGLSRARRVLVVAAVVGVVAALGLVTYLSATPYRPLYTDINPADAGAMKRVLDGQNIPNRLGAGGTSIEVPEDRLPQAQVTLAGEGLPAQGGKGYELFDETSLMTTPFVSQVNYQRALQAELARAIQQIESVQTARVLIARPEPSPFVRDQQAPTASVVLKLKPGAVMSRATAGGIVSLVARSVPGLTPANVTVVDSAGRLLSDPHSGDRDDLPTPQLEYRRELERYLASKAQEMLAQTLGAGRAIVQVNADVNFQKVKEQQVTYSPDGKVAQAERTTTFSSTGGATRGVVGAASNVARAGGPVPPASGSAAGSTTKEEVLQTDYALSKSIRDVENGMGAIDRLTVAVFVDLSAGEGGQVLSVEDAQEIVKQAVGFRPGRDEVKLANVRLAVPPTPEPDETLTRLQQIQAYVSIARNVSLAVAVFLVVLIVALLALRRRAPAEPPPAAPPSEEERRRAELERLAEMARTEPDRVADVFRMLLGAPAR